MATRPEGYLPLLDIWHSGRCGLGAHLHPWVNPPHTEAVTARNSFTCNLPIALQRDKLLSLADAIASRFDAAPRVFKAGRYGLGAATVELLHEAGFEVDTSICPRMDFTGMGGPSFVYFDAEPFFLTARLLEIPCTVDYTGWAGPARAWVHRLASRPPFARTPAVGALARAGVVNQVMLSPEGNTFEEMRALTRSLVARGQRTFTLSFHSPSVQPGHTPYVRDKAQLGAFLGALDRYCRFFLEELNGVSATFEEFRASCSSRLESGS